MSQPDEIASLRLQRQVDQAPEFYNDTGSLRADYRKVFPRKHLPKIPNISVASAGCSYGISVFLEPAKVIPG